MGRSTQHARASLGLVAAAALLAPAAASAQAAPSVGVDPGQCFLAGTPATLPVAGFPAVTALQATIPAADGTGGGTTVTDGAGAGQLSVELEDFRGQDVRAFRTTTLTVAPIDPAAAAVRVEAPVVLVSAPVATTAGARAGSPRRTVTWTFGAFARQGRPIYGHVRFRGRTLRTFRFGVAGPCGTLERRAPALPLKAGTPVRAGSYVIQLDSRRAYRRDAKAPSYRYRVATTLR